MDDSAMSSDPVIVILLGELVVKDWYKRSFPRGTYTVEIDVMHSLFKSSRKLFGLSTVLKVFNGSHSAKLDDLHHFKKAAIKDALRLLSSRLTLVAAHLTWQPPKQWLAYLSIERPNTDCSEEALTIIENPWQSNLTMVLLWKMHPHVAITGVACFKAITSTAISCVLMNSQDYSNLK
ncbi:hypothetical protein Nepgr_009036 [Nepenthes gracilis]|uniref:Uncharacterized protein n=1 Tax=Nepenthes gracilis TaxID=150966 RepID=A0AAD3SA61_NEPGR|nr:hypothetical protein Nepgr_009036 [Nepenthes gracilis]